MAKTPNSSYDKRIALLKEFHNQDLTIGKFCSKQKIKQSTFRDWLRKEKHVALANGENVEMFEKARAANMPNAYNQFPLEDKIKILRTVIFDGSPVKEASKKHNVSKSVISYWKKQWKDGKIIIPGLSPSEEPPAISRHSAMAKAKNGKPLSFDYEAQVEMGKLQAQIDYLKNLLENNNIEWAIDKTQGEARDDYLLAIIKANGIDVGLQSEIT